MNIFTDNTDYENIKKRIQNLTEKNTRQWGKMNVQQMLNHCIDALKMTIGDMEVADKSNFFTRTVVKGVALSGMKFPKSTPTAPELIKTETTFSSANLEEEKQILLAYIDKLKNASESDFKPHPVFGKMNRIEYGKLVYKHLDHHLRQFGV